MTTTDIYQGLGDGKNSSRVLRAPGGGSTIDGVFGTEAPDYRKTKSKSFQHQDAGEDNRAAGVINPKDTATSHSRLFGGDEDEDKASGSPVVQAEVNSPAGKTSAQLNRVTTDCDEADTASGITACRKRIFKNEGRDDEEEDEEEKKKREEEEKKKAEEERNRSRSVAKPPRGAYNPITGQDYSDQPTSAPQGRQRQPPGGHSQGLW